MQNSNLKDGTEVPTSTTADTTTSSQTIAKPNVSGSLLIDKLRYAFNAGQNLTESKYGNMQNF